MIEGFFNTVGIKFGCWWPFLPQWIIFLPAPLPKTLETANIHRVKRCVSAGILRRRRVDFSGYFKKNITQGIKLAEQSDIERRPEMTDKKTDKDDGGQSQVVLETRPRTKKPSMYKVIMLNDDYTPMEFVVYVLQRFFSMSNSQATAIMLNVHQRGVGICGIYSYEVAEAKATQVMDYARQNEHPLQLQIEKE